MNFNVILETFKDKINWYKIKERGNNKVFSVNFKEEVLFEDLIKVIKSNVNNDYELILSRICSGEIIDSNVKSFEILDGIFLELYDFKSEEVYFIRVYKIKDINTGKVFTNLYIDIVKNSAWW